MDLFNSRYFDGFEDFLLNFFQHNPIIAPFLMLILEEAGFPIPIEDIVITYTGYQVAKGTISFFAAYVGLVTADLIGATILYYIASKYGQTLILKFGKYIHLNTHKLLLIEEKFKKYGALCIILGRHIPGFRVPITIFSGMSEVTYKTFIISTFLSIVWWIPIYLGIGQKLGPAAVSLFHRHTYLTLIFTLVPVILIIVLIFYLRGKKKKKKEKNLT